MRFFDPFRWMFTWWECVYLLALVLVQAFVDADLTTASLLIMTGFVMCLAAGG